MSNLDLFKVFAPKDKRQHVTGNKAVIYTRVSDTSQEDNTSLESQLKYCKVFADKKGLEVIEYFGGKVESAKTDDRPEFKRMLKFIKQSHGVSHVIVYSYERFTRTGVSGAKIADDLLKQYGIVTLAVTQELDPTTAAGSFQQKIFFLFSEMDNQMRRDKTVMGMTELTAKGYTPYSVPRGYVNLNKGARAVDQKIVPNKEGELLKKAFMWKAKEGLGNTAIVRRLKELGMNIDKRRLGSIFANPYYCGIIVNKLLPSQVIEGKHQPIVSREIFLKVNNIVAANRTHPAKHKQIDENLPLKAIMRCATCDTPMTGFLVKNKGLYYYKCRTQGCNHNISAKKTHETIEAILESFQIDTEDLPIVEQAVRTYYDAFFEEYVEERKLKTTQVNKIKNQIETVEERFVLGEINRDLYDKFRQKYEQELRELGDNSMQVGELSSNLEKCLKKVLEFCQNPRMMWDSAGVMERINLLKVLFPEGIKHNKENSAVLTNRINSLFAPIVELAGLLGGNKKGQPISFDQLSFRVTPEGF